ncbi:MAG: lipoprotein [Gammaproteobacteria bacterium]|nr:lipoprotein [Gammaproteobacteria bacterium]
MNNLFTKTTAWLLASIFATTVLLAGCGQTGALYLPDDEQEEEEQSQDSG